MKEVSKFREEQEFLEKVLEFLRKELMRLIILIIEIWNRIIFQIKCAIWLRSNFSYILDGN